MVSVVCSGLEQSREAKKIKRRTLSVSLLFAAAMILDACKQPVRPSESVVLLSDSASDTAAEILVANQNTTLKKYLLQSAVLGSADVCPIPEGTKITVESLRHEGVGHWRVFRLSEVQLPSGEIAQRARESNETTTGSVSNNASEAGSTALPPTTSTAAAEPQEVPEPEAATKKVPTPAELLNCKLLENDSFLGFSSHFKRESVPEKSLPGAREPDPENNIGSSTWIWPTRGRKIRSDSAGSGYFNAPRASGRGHQGVDIIAAVGEPVMASRSGTIIDPNWEGSYGRVVDVKHSGGLMSRYAHLNSFTYSHGTYVRQGDRIGTAGRTGNASGYGITPHLHFEIRSGSRLYNPLSLLPY